MDSTEIVIVLDPELDEGSLWTILSRFPVWAVDSPHNRKIAEQYWPSSSAPMTERGISLFSVENNAAREHNLGVSLELVDDHHNEWAASPAYNAVRVVGIDVTPQVLRTCEEFGFSRIEPTPDGFRCYFD